MATGDFVSSPSLSGHRRAVGVFPNRADAEQAMHELQRSGFPMQKVSVITRDADRSDDIAGAEVHDRVGNKADEGAKVGALSGGALGGLTGLLVGLGTLAIPGIGPVMLAGAAATTLATTLAGGAIGAAAGGLIGALVGLGIPEERARVYNERVARGEYLVIVDGTDAEIDRADAILKHRGIQEYGIYNAPVPASSVSVPPTVPGTGAARAAGVTDRAFDPRKRALGVFSSRREVEAALMELRNSGFPMDDLSVVAKNADPNDRIAGVDVDPRTGNKADEGAKAGAATGGALGGLGGLLVGLGALAIPGIGPVMAGGALATALATTVSGGALGAAAGGLTGALVGLGIPEARAQMYNDRLMRGNYLVMVEGPEREIRQAEAIFNRHGIHDWNIFDDSRTADQRRDDISSQGSVTRSGDRNISPVGRPDYPQGS